MHQSSPKVESATNISKATFYMAGLMSLIGLVTLMHDPILDRRKEKQSPGTSEKTNISQNSSLYLMQNQSTILKGVPHEQEDYRSV